MNQESTLMFSHQMRVTLDPFTVGRLGDVRVCVSPKSVSGELESQKGVRQVI